MCFDKILAFMRYDASVGCGLVITLSRALVGKVRGCDIDFLRCSFRLFPRQPHVGEMPSPKIGSSPGFSKRSIRPATVPRVSVHSSTTRHQVRLSRASRFWGQGNASDPVPPSNNKQPKQPLHLPQPRHQQKDNYPARPYLLPIPSPRRKQLKPSSKPMSHA